MEDAEALPVLSGECIHIGILGTIYECWEQGGIWFIRSCMACGKLMKGILNL